MKTFILALGIVAFMGVAVSLIPNEYAVVGNTIEEEEIVEEEPVNPEWEKEAKEAYEAVLRRKALEAEKNLLEASFEAYRASTTARLEAIDKELSF